MKTKKREADEEGGRREGIIKEEKEGIIKEEKEAKKHGLVICNR